MADIATLIFLLQQFGIALGLGAATFSLFFYVMSTRDGVIDDTEKHFVHATNTVLVFSLFLIVVTGALITGAHFLAGEIAIMKAPVFVSKWLLIIIIMLSGVLVALRAFSTFIGATVSGASWYALFIIHTLSPDVSWGVLGLGYLLWLSIFALGFFAIQKGGTTAPTNSAPRKKEVQVKRVQEKVILPRIPISKYVTPTITPTRAPSTHFDLSKGLAQASSAVSVIDTR